MREKDNYINQLQKQMDNYKEKISKIDSLLENYALGGKRPELLAQRENLKEKFNQAEKIFRELQLSSEADFEKIKEDARKIFEDVKEAFHDFSNFLTMEQLYRSKDEIISFGNEKLDEVQNLIKKYPLTVATVAISIGFIVGTLLARSK